MTRYFFNTYDSVTRIDAEGADFETWEEARKEAICAASEVLKFHPQRLIAGDDWRLEVTDARGLVLLRLDFLITESPAMQRAGGTKTTS